MINRHSAKFIIFSVICALGVNGGLSNSAKCYSEPLPSAFSPLKTYDLNNMPNPQTASELRVELNRTENNYKTIDLNQDDNSDNLANATDKFVQCNVRASWDDFKSLIMTPQDNDFLYISLANKMADMGLFDLANLASFKIKDKELSNVSIDAMKRFYYPRTKLRQEDELVLAEIYSNITFNNQSAEATEELLKKDVLLSNYDYANYLVALGSYKSSSFTRAAKYINIAVLQNPTNLNYQRLKAEILAETGQPEEALKTVENLKRQDLYSYEYEKKIKSLEQFVLYKTRKAPWEKNYHLGYYYYLENDPSKAIRTLQNCFLAKKKGNASLIYGLMSEIYLSMDEFEKAADTAKKSHKINSGNPMALITLGDLSYAKQDYKQALSYYKKATSQDRKSYVPFIKEAKTYQQLSNTKKATEIYTKLLKTHSDSWEAYYNVALLDNSKKTIYLKKALAVNPLFEDGWIELAKNEINYGNYNIAQKYLANAFSIDENDFKYYYYQGLVNNSTGDYAKAKYNFKKCLKLNHSYKEAQSALDSILNKEFDSKQDSI